MGTFQLDGQAVPFRDGETVLQAARRAGHEIPSLCFDPRLEAMGACRVCAVKVNGRIAASCTARAAPGLEVTVDAEVRALRRTLVELAGSLLPGGECPRCRLDGRCEFHRVADGVGARPGRFAGAPGGARHADDNPFLGRDYSRCINCYRCVRICDEVQGDTALAVRGRGFDATIATWLDRGLEDSSCELCGQCIHTCPTGALTDRKLEARLAEVERRSGSPVAAAEIGHTRSICPYCGTGCGVDLRTARGELLGVGPVADAPASEGALCVKGQWGTDFVSSPDRLRAPLVREGDRFREASWDEAIGIVAERLLENRRRHGPDAFAAWASARTTSEANYLLMKIARGLVGTNNVDNCQRT